MKILTVRLLVTSASTWTTKLLGLATARISNKQRTIISNQLVTQLLLGGLIYILLVVRNNTLGQSLADSVNLGSVTATLDGDADVDLGKGLLAQNQDGLENLQAKSLGLSEFDGLAIELDQAVSGLALSDSGGSLLASKGLDRLNRSGNGGHLLIQILGWMVITYEARRLSDLI